MIPCTSPDGGNPRLLWKPLDAIIGQVLMSYHPGEQQGCKPKNKMTKMHHMQAISLAMVMRRYDTKHITQWRGSVAAKFECTAYMKLAAGKILNICKFEYTYVFSNLFDHFVA